VVVTGARQTGKSTLVRDLEPGAGRLYVTLDDIDVLQRAREEPDALLAAADRITLDEVQRAPELLLAVKRAIDERREPGRFLLTGSADLLLMQRVSESLAGRAVHFALRPMTRSELDGRPEAGAWTQLFEAEGGDWPQLLRERDGAKAEWRAHVAVGGYPTPAYELPDSAARTLWFAGYTQTYLERDLRDLSSVSSLFDFRRLMRAACLRLGGLVNQTELGRDVGLPQSTVHRWLDLLETSYQLARLPAYSVNRTKRLMRSPKLYWNDSGLALHLSGEEEPRGAHLENFVLADLLAWSGSVPDGPQVMHWRTSSGLEVDLVVEWRGRVLPIELKGGQTVRLGDARGLRAFRDEYPDLSRAGLLLHAGDELGWLADGVLAAPWWHVL
jgi:predicted AAA+ superfamily ATPase